jgi:hypothetical protein
VSEGRLIAKRTQLLWSGLLIPLGFYRYRAQDAQATVA